MTHDDRTLLQTAGFVDDVHGGLPALVFSTKGAGAVERLAVVHENGRFRCVNPPTRPGGCALRFETQDVRDVVALAVALENQRTFEAEGAVAGESGFADDGTFIHNAFADSQYGDWAGRRTDSGDYELQSPARTYGDRYVFWRDAHARRLVDEARGGASKA